MSFNYTSTKCKKERREETRTEVIERTVNYFSVPRMVPTKKISKQFSTNNRQVCFSKVRRVDAHGIYFERERFTHITVNE